MKSIFEEMGGTYRQEGVTEALKAAAHTGPAFVCTYLPFTGSPV